MGRLKKKTSSLMILLNEKPLYPEKKTGEKNCVELEIKYLD